MLINSKRLYEYPLLCEYNDDYHKKEFFIGSVDKMKKASKKLSITVRVDIKDKQILTYVKEGYVKPIAHLYSSATKYRDYIELELGENTLEIENKNVDKVLEISHLLVVTKDIENFTNPNFNADYKNFKFKVEAGSIIAVGKVEKVFIEKDINELTKVKSVINIVRGEFEQGFMQVDFLEEKIRITLSNSDFKIYQTYVNNCQAMLHSMIIVPALIYVLDCLKDEQYYHECEDRKWFRVFSKKYESIMGKKFSKENIEEENSLEMIQKLLEGPLENALTMLENQLDKTGGDSDEN